MDAIGYLYDAVVYFLLVVGTVAAMVWRVDDKLAVPGASPWRMRSPKLFTCAGPVLFVLGLMLGMTGSPVWVSAALWIGSLIAPWVGAVLIAVEWRRRRAEDRVRGAARPPWPSSWS